MEGLRVSDRVVLVTGAARGIGLETARALHERGASVAVVEILAGRQLVRDVIVEAERRGGEEA